MKDLKKNITVIMIIFISLFTILVGYFLYDVLLYSGRWISSAYNPRLKEQRSSVIPGSIFDVNEIELAGSSYSKRTYIEDDNIRLSIGHVVGDIYGFSPSGVETTQGAWLLGFNEGLMDRIMRVLVSETAHGSDITLTLDAKLNSQIADLFEKNSGAVVVLNYKTGEILSMVSLPEFDLSKIDVTLTHGGANEESLVNRALQSTYPSGTVFKVVTAASAMQFLDLTNKSFTCKGTYFKEDGEIICDTLHDNQTFEEMISNNCISSLAEISSEIGYKRLKKTAEELGYNHQFLFSDLVLYESELSLSSLSSEHDLASAGIGIGKVATTPMHMAMIYGAIANEGKINPLKLLKDIEDVDISKRNEALRKSFDYAIAHKLNDILLGSNPIIIGDTSICAVVSEVEVNNNEYYKNVSILSGYSNNSDYPYSIAIVMEDYEGSLNNLRDKTKLIYNMIIENGDFNED